MPIKLRVISNLKDLPKFLDETKNKAVIASAKRAISRAAVHVRTEAVKEIRQRKLVNLASLKINESRNRYIKTLDFTKSGGKNGLHAEVQFSDERIGLVHFFSKKVAAGRSKLTGVRLYAVQFQIFGVVRSSRVGFIPQKNRRVMFARKGKSRLPIRRMFGPSVAILVDKSGAAESLLKKGTARFFREFQLEFDKRMAGIIKSKK